jgi:tRNA (Thr-GGU) A37 N-methylase
MDWTVRPIAWVRSTRTEPIDDRWDAEWSTIELDDDVPDEALVGLGDYSHVVVVYLFDRASDVPPGP